MNIDEMTEIIKSIEPQMDEYVKEKNGNGVILFWFDKECHSAIMKCTTGHQMIAAQTLKEEIMKDIDPAVAKSIVDKVQALNEGLKQIMQLPDHDAE